MGHPDGNLDADKTDRMRFFRLMAGGERSARGFPFSPTARPIGGAESLFQPADQPTPDWRFAVWAPKRTNVEVVFATTASGYNRDDGHGIDPAAGLGDDTRAARYLGRPTLIPRPRCARRAALHVPDQKRARAYHL